MRAVFIRHGQSTANAGIPGGDVAGFELTETGWDQARRTAAAWQEPPRLIVVSPYLRAQQTAQPTLDRFPGVPVEIWPIQEHTYLAPSRWNGSSQEERRPHVERYWAAADPAYCDGEGAESFSRLLRRCEAALARLAALPPDTLVYLFSHGQFMQALRSIVTLPELTERQRMEGFWRREGPPAIANGERLALTGSGGWTLQGMPAA